MQKSTGSTCTARRRGDSAARESECWKPARRRQSLGYGGGLVATIKLRRRRHCRCPHGCRDGHLSMEGASDRALRASWRGCEANGPYPEGWTLVLMSQNGERKRQRVGLRASCTADNASTSRRRSGAALLFCSAEERRKPARSWRGGVKRTSTGANGAAKHSRQRSRFGRSGARAAGRLQRSVRSIFPRPSLSPERATEAASDSTDRLLHVTGSWFASGDKGAGSTRGSRTANTKKTRSDSDVGHRAEGRRPGSRMLCRPNTAAEDHGPGTAVTA